MTTGTANPESSGAGAAAAESSRRIEWKSRFGPGRDELLAAIATREGTVPELREVVFRGKEVTFAGIESSATADLAEVFVSMANTNGGLVVLGVRERDRAIVGVEPERRKTLERFLVNIATARCDPQIVPEVYWRHLPDAAGAERLCLVIYIAPSFRMFHCTADGRYLRRSEGRRFLMPAHLLEPVLKRQRPPRPPIEDRPAPRAPLSALDGTLLDAYFRRRALPQPPALETRLRAHRFAAETDRGAIVPTLLGLLIFCRRPDEHWPGAFIEIESYPSDDPDAGPTDTKRVTGPLPQQVNDAVSFFAESLSPAADPSKRGSDAPAWSLPAFQEAVVNAVIHREYSIPAPVVIRRFPTRIEVENPGSLFRDQSPDHLYAGAAFQQRNQMLAGILYHFDSRVTGRPLAKGTEPGFLPLMRECERLSGRRPLVEEPGDATRLTIYTAAATGADIACERTRIAKE